MTVAKKTAEGGGAALTIAIQNAGRPYGTSDPQFNYVVTGALVNADTYAHYPEVSNRDGGNPNVHRRLRVTQSRNGRIGA